jgi:hypothetical protein
MTMADKEQREYDAKLDAIPEAYAKCRKCRVEQPTRGMTDGVCEGCLTGKHYCEDCEWCFVPGSLDREFSRCKKDLTTFFSRKARLYRGYEEENEQDKYEYCRRDHDQCENFKFSEDVLAGEEE